MKLIHLIYDSPANPWLGGGGAIRTNEIYSRIKNAEIKIYRGQYPLANSKKIKNIANIYAGYGKKSYFLSRLTYWFKSIGILRKNNSDLIIEEIGPLPTFNLFNKKNIIGIVQVILNKEYVKKRGLIGFILEKMQKLAFKRYKYFIAVSQNVKKEILKSNPCAEVFVIYSGVEQQQINHKEKDYILYLGRIDYMGKGLNKLLEGYLAANTKTKLLIAGSGEIKEICKINKAIKNLGLVNSVKLVGKIYGKEKEDLIKNCLFICSASTHEAFPLTILEAYSHSKSVLVSDIPAHRELVENSKGGILFKLNSKEELGEKLNTLIENKHLRKQMGENGYSYSKKFSWEKCAKETYEVYKQVIKETKNPKKQ